MADNPNDESGTWKPSADSHLGRMRSAVEQWAELSEQEPLTPEVEQGLRGAALDRAREKLLSLNLELGDDSLFTEIPQAAAAALHLGQLDLAHSLALRALALARTRKDHWHYGNAIHLAHTVLGLIALRAGDQPGAVEGLRLAGATPGSPQLMSFGPTMQLALELLQLGLREPVLEYFAQCRQFWFMGDRYLAIWDAKVRAGAIPNFFHYRFV